jgi:hypothetical protein
MDGKNTAKNVIKCQLITKINLIYKATIPIQNHLSMIKTVPLRFPPSLPLHLLLTSDSGFNYKEVSIHQVFHKSILYFKIKE